MTFCQDKQTVQPRGHEYWSERKGISCTYRAGHPNLTAPGTAWQCPGPALFPGRWHPSLPPALAGHSTRSVTVQNAPVRGPGIEKQRWHFHVPRSRCSLPPTHQQHLALDSAGPQAGVTSCSPPGLSPEPPHTGHRLPGRWMLWGDRRWAEGWQDTWGVAGHLGGGRTPGQVCTAPSPQPQALLLPAVPLSPVGVAVPTKAAAPPLSPIIKNNISATAVSWFGWYVKLEWKGLLGNFFFSFTATSLTSLWISFKLGWNTVHLPPKPEPKWCEKEPTKGFLWDLVLPAQAALIRDCRQRNNFF